jgi:glycosyltransferase involved in cell wall biosynthesis
MKIEFYHIDAFEVANYEPIWRKLIAMGVEARMVAVHSNHNTAEPGWFDYDRFSDYCAEREIPFTTEVDPLADIGITTQNADILRDYSYRVRLMYGPVVYPAAWALQPHSVKHFDAVLTHGQTYTDYFSSWLPREQLPIIGYPRYDNFFAGKLQKEEIHERWGLTNKKPVLVFLPTWGNNTGFDTFFPALLALADRYHIVLRPHHCTLRFEFERMELMRNSGLLILNNAFDLDEIYAGADVVVADVRSGGLFEAFTCGVPAVGMILDATDLDWLVQAGVDKMASLCSNPDDLASALEVAITSAAQVIKRQQWAERNVAYRDGDAAQQAAEALITLAMAKSIKKTQILPMKNGVGSLLTPVFKTNLDNN